MAGTEALGPRVEVVRRGRVRSLEIAWPKRRALLGANRLSLPTAVPNRSSDRSNIDSAPKMRPDPVD